VAIDITTFSADEGCDRVLAEDDLESQRNVEDIAANLGTNCDTPRNTASSLLMSTFGV